MAAEHGIQKIAQCIDSIPSNSALELWWAGPVSLVLTEVLNIKDAWGALAKGWIFHQSTHITQAYLN